MTSQSGSVPVKMSAEGRTRFYRVSRFKRFAVTAPGGARPARKELHKKQLRPRFLQAVQGDKKNSGIRAEVKQLRTSARKLTRVLRLIRGKDLAEAFAILKFTPKRAARLIEKGLQSARGNAEEWNRSRKADDHGATVDVERLYVSTAVADQGPTLSRVRPMSMGRVGRIRKRTANITLILKEKPEAANKPKAKSAGASGDATHADSKGAN